MSYRERLEYVIPGGAHTYSRGADQFPENAPDIFKRGKGAYLYTADDTPILDYGMGLRSVNLGYANDEVNEAAIKQIEYGNNLTRPSLVELEAAELMVKTVAAADMVKFAKNGSAVTTAAVKLARAHTGKNIILRCADHPFFSYDDWFIGSTVMDKGIPLSTKKETLTFKYNDIDDLKNLIGSTADIACVILEPSTVEHPKDDYLNKVKQLCHDNSIVFILDEMITGFRWALGGAQEYYKVEPDISTFGKAMANGFSVAALAGKREIMELGGISTEGEERLFLLSTTHGAEMCSLGAFVATVNFLVKNKVIEKNWGYGEKLIDGMNNVARELNIEDKFYLTGIPCSPNFVARNVAGEVDLKFRTLFLQEMIENGVLMPWVAISYSHGDEELEKTLDAAGKALSVYRDALNSGIDSFLRSPAIKPVFRKYN